MKITFLPRELILHFVMLYNHITYPIHLQGTCCQTRRLDDPMPYILLPRIDNGFLGDTLFGHKVFLHTFSYFLSSSKFGRTGTKYTCNLLNPNCCNILIHSE